MKYFFLFTFFVLCSCNNNRSKKKLKTTIPICSQRIFVEKYEISGGGAYDGDIVSAYLTDSNNFRIYLRTYDNAHESMRFECSGKDNIIVYYLVQDTATYKFETHDTSVYNIPFLKKKKIFE